MHALSLPLLLLFFLFYFCFAFNILSPTKTATHPVGPLRYGPAVLLAPSPACVGLLVGCRSRLPPAMGLGVERAVVMDFVDVFGGRARPMSALVTVEGGRSWRSSMATGCVLFLVRVSWLVPSGRLVRVARGCFIFLFYVCVFVAFSPTSHHLPGPTPVSSGQGFTFRLGTKAGGNGTTVGRGATATPFSPKFSAKGGRGLAWPAL